MTREQLEELAALHALGLLSESDKADFEEKLADDPELRRLAAELKVATEGLALSAESREPPAELKEKILDGLPDKREQPPKPANPARISTWIPWAIAAGLALTCGLLVRKNIQLTQRSGTLHSQIANLQHINTLAGIQIAQLKSLVGSTANASAVCVWDHEKQEGILTVDHLPPAAANKDYQLWVVDPDYPNPVSGGVFSVAPDGQARVQFKPVKPVTKAEAFAVSIERKGGVPKAQGPIVLASDH